MGLIGRIVGSRPRLFLAMLVGLALFAILPAALPIQTRSLVAWDVASGVYVIAAMMLFLGGRQPDMAHAAARQQEGEWTVFFITVGAAVFSLGAVLTEFSGIKDLTTGARELHIALVAGTLALSWMMTHVTFAFRYAHEYYEAKPGGGVAGGLLFPAEPGVNEPPDYSDFIYFALVLGMTFQVSDVQITTREFRRLAALHGLLAFLFNATIIALTVNIAAGLL